MIICEGVDTVSVAFRLRQHRSVSSVSRIFLIFVTSRMDAAAADRGDDNMSKSGHQRIDECQTRPGVKRMVNTF